LFILPSGDHVVYFIFAHGVEFLAGDAELDPAPRKKF